MTYNHQNKKILNNHAYCSSAVGHLKRDRMLKLVFNFFWSFTICGTTISAQEPGGIGALEQRSKTTSNEIIEKATPEPDLWRDIAREFTLSTRYAGKPINPLDHFIGPLKHITLASQRATPYLAHINKEIQKRGLPAEIALIPIIESGYKPHATSSSGAAGLWQLMPATANRFGLHQSKWYDGRRDIIASTRAALDYFEELRDRFRGDWKLIFAAYHSGERTIERAIELNLQQGLSTDFYSLRLPKLTEAYVPKLLAVTEIIANPQAFGLELAKISNSEPFEEINVGVGLDLNRILIWTDLDEKTFDILNPAHLKKLTIEGPPPTVLVPIAVANIIRNELALVEPSSRYRPRIITVEPNDTLSEISFLTGLSVEKIKKFNSLRSNRLRIGQRLLIPMPRVAPPIDPTILSKRLIATEHVVAANDTLWGIAAYYKTTIDNLIKENNIPPGSVLKIGQKLILPSRLPNGEDSNYHTVEQGESLWTIATKLGTTVKDLTNLNRLHDESILKIGQVIRVQ